MKSDKLIIRIIKSKKEVYYSLFSISVSYLLYLIFILFINLADSQVVLPFLFLSVTILIFLYSLDIYYDSKRYNESTSKKLIFFLIFFSIAISFIAVLRLIILILFDIYYLIPISIHFLASIIIYYILRKEVKKYYSTKNKQNIEQSKNHL